MVYKIIARRNGDWVFLVFQLFLTCIMAAMVYMAALWHGSARLGSIVALVVVSLWWLINEGFMVKYISTLPSDDKVPVRREVSAEESWRKLCKKYDVLDEEQKSAEEKDEEEVKGKTKKDSAEVAKKEDKKASSGVAKKSDGVAKKATKKHFRLLAKQEKRAKKSAKTAAKKSASVEKSTSDSDTAATQDIPDAQGASTSAPQGILDKNDVTPSDESVSQDNSSDYTVSEFRDYFNRFRDEKDLQAYFEKLQSEDEDAEDLQDADGGSADDFTLSDPNGESADDATLSDPQGISDEQDSVTYNDADSSDNSSTHTVSEFRDYFNRFQEEKHKED